MNHTRRALCHDVHLNFTRPHSPKAAHVTWPTDSRRKAELPDDWPTIRAAVLNRDGHRCTWILEAGQRCNAPASDVDHGDDRHDHTLANLRSLCSPHHDRRTAMQGVGERARRRQLGRRPAQPHPGLVP